MKKLKNSEVVKLIIVVIGILVLVFIMLSNFSCGGLNQRGPRVVKETRQELEAQKKPQEKEVPKKIQNLLTTVGRDDPFIPPAQKGKMQGPGYSSFVLVGIVWDEKNPYAIINNNILSIGDVVNQRKIIRIDKEAVFLEKDGNVVSLKVGESLKN